MTTSVVLLLAALWALKDLPQIRSGPMPALRLMLNVVHDTLAPLLI